MFHVATTYLRKCFQILIDLFSRYLGVHPVPRLVLPRPEAAFTLTPTSTPADLVEGVEVTTTRHQPLHPSSTSWRSRTQN